MKKSHPYPLNPNNAALIFSCLAPRNIYHYSQGGAVKKQEEIALVEKQKQKPVEKKSEKSVPTLVESKFFSQGQVEALCLLHLGCRYPR